MTLGGLLWRYSTVRMNFSSRRELAEVQEKQVNSGSIILTVDGRDITYADLEWELMVETHSIKTAGNPDDIDGDPAAFVENTEEPIENDLAETEKVVEVSDKEDLSALRHKLLSLMVERILLYQAVSADSNFTIDDSKRFKQCDEDTKAMAKAAPELFKDKESQQRLRNQLCEKSIIDQYVQENMAKDIAVTDSEIKSYYDDRKQEFSYPTRVAIRQIVLPTENIAKDVRAKLSRTNFAQMAEKHSIAPEAIEGGKLAPFAKGQYPGVFDVAFSMKRGQISSIMKSEYGFHIILLENKMHGGMENLNKASAKITEILRDQKLRKVYQQWLEKALARAEIKSDYQIW